MLLMLPYYSYYTSWAEAIKSHLVSVELYLNPRYSVLDRTVVVGSAVPIARNTAFQVRALAVPLSLILIINWRPCTSVPQGALNNSAPACAVIINSSRLSILREVPVFVV